jgi:hypothetical protein
MDTSQYQNERAFTESRKLKASRSKAAIAGANLRPNWWLHTPDTNVTTTVPSQVTNSIQSESAYVIECHDQHQCIPEESISALENGETLCRNHMKEETEHSIDSGITVHREAISHDAKWEIMFNRLVDFKKKYGHCFVPNRYKNDNKLGSWVSTQRKQYKALACGRYDATILPAHRIKKLDEIGFAWNTSDPRRVDWEVRYSQLKDFFCKYGK